MIEVTNMPSALTLARRWFDNFKKYGTDIYPESVYPQYHTLDGWITLAEQAIEIYHLAQEKESAILVHNYLGPEFHEMVWEFSKPEYDPIGFSSGDSLNLSLWVQKYKFKRVDFQSVSFMAQTAKLIAGHHTRVFTPDDPATLGCSLVFGTDHTWILKWKEDNPGAPLVTYINSDAYTKSLCDYVSTSANTDKIIVQAIKDNPGKPILVLPDKFLGQVMKMRALRMLKEQGIEIDPNLIQIYHEYYNGQEACCYVHNMIGKDAALKALDRYPGAHLMIHPECGCSATCMTDLELGRLDPNRAVFKSTTGMSDYARDTDATQFIVATESGMLYKLRRENEDLGKEFIPIDTAVHCRYMKGNTFEKLIRSLKEDRIEIVLCNDCCDPENPVVTDREIHIQWSIAEQAKIGIDRMLEIV